MKIIHLMAITAGNQLVKVTNRSTGAMYDMDTAFNWCSKLRRNHYRDLNKDDVVVGLHSEIRTEPYHQTLLVLEINK